MLRYSCLHSSFSRGKIKPGSEMNMGKINKEQFLATLFCPTYGWLLRSGLTQEQLSPAEKLRIEEGLEIHQRARGLFPGGIMVSGNNEVSVRTTQQLLLDPNTTVIFEATFIYQDYVTKADVLIRDNSQWKIIEVKSNVNDDKELVDDLSYTTFVAQSAGLQISNCSLLLVSKDYRLGMSDENLFKEIDHTAKVLGRANEFRELSVEIAHTLSSSEKPAPELRWECKGCDIFEQCCGENIENHIFDLPRISHTRFCQLKDMGVIIVEDIPGDFELSDSQTRVRQAVLSGKPIVDREGLRSALNSIVHPAYYLDFETVQTCIPLYENIAPYGQIPTQYSLHICRDIGEVVEHKEYLADPEHNCSRTLAERLLRDCGSEGSIVVYTSFEKTIINRLAESFPDLKDELEGLVRRLVDLHAILRRNYYHPGFHGSYSIKKVLPVVVPDMGYEGMVVDNGLDASALFANMAKGRYNREQASRVRESLLEYCGVDTMAMVRLVEGMELIVE